tara:strand:+ start:182 stop:316 length:135 start_codon:yes stop_codon:yes gene_type:complete
VVVLDFHSVAEAAEPVALVDPVAVQILKVVLVVLEGNLLLLVRL